MCYSHKNCLSLSNIFLSPTLRPGAYWHIAACQIIMTQHYTRDLHIAFFQLANLHLSFPPIWKNFMLLITAEVPLDMFLLCGQHTASSGFHSKHKNCHAPLETRLLCADKQTHARHQPFWSQHKTDGRVRLSFCFKNTGPPKLTNQFSPHTSGQVTAAIHEAERKYRSCALWAPLKILTLI